MTNFLCSHKVQVELNYIVALCAAKFQIWLQVLINRTHIKNDIDVCLQFVVCWAHTNPATLFYCSVYVGVF